MSDTAEFEKIDVRDVLTKLNTSEKGLSQEEVKKRIKKFGYNEVSEKKVNPVFKFLSYFWGPIPWMIEIAAALSAIIRHWSDFAIIFALLLLNGVVGFFEESKAQNVISVLKQKLALNSKVLRDGKWIEIPARELVPGDIVRIRIGDIVPADIKLIDGDYIHIDESALTGESLPVEKTVKEIAYSGSIVTKGEMTGVVTGTGLNTFFGKTVQLVEEARTISSFQKMVTKVGDYLIIMALILISLISIVGIYRQESLLGIIRFSLILMVAAIPAAMPAVLSITMAVGALNLAKRHTVVTKLVSIEELAGVDILCSDKTGTLTKNHLTAGEPVPFNNYKKEDVILYAALASRIEDRDPIDTVIFDAIETYNLNERIKNLKQISFTPFDSVIKRTEAEISNNEKFRVTKGAPQVILEICKRNGIEERVNRKIDEFGRKGYRTLGVAKYEKEWKFVGIIPLFDPPRDDAKNAIEKIKNLFVKIKMITGDNISIAKYISGLLGLGKKIFTINEIFGLKKESEIIKLIEEADGFSEVFPEHKYKIIDALQKNGHLIAMTGDGINDAPALKKANCGIAVSGATDAARAAADVVLLQPGLSIIADAIEEARRIFVRMESYVIYRITETIRVLYFIVFVILAYNIYPITATMIVLLALFNDAPILAIAYDNVRKLRSPSKWNTKKVLSLSTLLGFTGVIESLILFYVGESILGLKIAELQSFIFLKLAVAGHLTIFVTRTSSHLWEKPHPSNILLWSAVITKILATVIVVYGIFVTPIGWKLAILIWIYALAWIFIEDWVKLYALKRLGE